MHKHNINLKSIPQRILLNLLMLTGILCLNAFADETEPNGDVDKPVIVSDAKNRIIIEAHTDRPDVPDFYTAVANANVVVGTQRIDQTIKISANIVQGQARSLNLGLLGNGQVTNVEGDGIQSWAVRQQGKLRFLDIYPKEDVRKIQGTIKIQSAKLKLPATIELTHLSPGDAVGFNATIKLKYSSGVAGAVTAVEGFAPLGTRKRANQFQTATGGKIRLSLNRDGAAPGPIELTDTSLVGTLDENGRSMTFRFRGTAHVTEPDATLTILSGNAAANEVPTGQEYRLSIAAIKDRSTYQLTFPKPGKIPVELDFVVPLSAPNSNWQNMDFTVAAGAVVPITLKGLDENLEFGRENQTIVPLRDDQDWVGFLPVTGNARLRWRTARKGGEGKLFFSTTARVEAQVGAGLLRQVHQIDYKILQGELRSIQIDIEGPGEILDVQGANIVSWRVTGEEGNPRQLQATLSQPITESSTFTIISQNPLGAFPVRVAGMRLAPVGAIRHSGHLRLVNNGAVRLEPTGLTGLTQLTPQQFPGDAVKARQVFVYRFPASDHNFEIVADRIQPEVNIAQLVRYEFAETDRVIRADIELDIREAQIREWDFGIPDDYSVVSVTGASVADYVTSTEAVDNQRNLKVIFGKDVIGRQLVMLHLEKNEPAAAGDWELPLIKYPEAKNIRGNIGVFGAPGFRIAVKETALLVEKPLSYFPKPTPQLQQAFRIREPGWSATMNVEQLERSVQADVFHLYSLSQEMIYGSALFNYFVTGAPVSEWRIKVPQSLGNVMVDGQNVRTWRREGETLIIALHQPVMGPYTLLVTFEEKANSNQGTFQAGQVEPLDVNGERGFIQVASPMQVEMKTVNATDGLLQLEPLELPAEFRLLSTAPPLGTWQYTDRPFGLNLQVSWFEPGSTVPQVVEFSEANSRVSQDGELVTDVIYFVKSRGQRALKIKLPEDPVRLWEVTVNDRPVTARQTDTATLVPLPGNVDPNIPIKVSLRLGKPSVNRRFPKLALPVVYAPVLKTQWNIVGDERRILIPGSGTVTPPEPVLRPSGFHWVANRGLGWFILTGVLALLGGLGCRSKALAIWKPISLVALAVAVIVSCAAAGDAASSMRAPSPLQLDLPVLATGEVVELQVRNTLHWSANFTSIGIISVALGIAAIVWSFLLSEDEYDEEKQAAWISLRTLFRILGAFLIGLGLLWHRDGASFFFGTAAAAIFLLMFLPAAWQWIGTVRSAWKEAAKRRAARRAEAEAAKPDEPNADGGEPGGGAIATTILLIALGLSLLADDASATIPAGFSAADEIKQEWEISGSDARLKAKGSVTLTGQPGDRFLLLRAPAVLTSFEGEGLRLTKSQVPNFGMAYVISIPSEVVSVDPDAEPEENDEEESDEDETVETPPSKFSATFAYQLESLTPMQGIPELTGLAAVQQVEVGYDEADWEISSPQAVRIETLEAGENATRARVLFGGSGKLFVKPKARDVSSETKQFFVEASNLYLPAPGVIDGRHVLNVRMSQGQVTELNVKVPKGLTVSEVAGPVGSWQFDAEKGDLHLELEPPQSSTFSIRIDTQRGLDPLPVDVQLAPLTVADANGQVGLLAIGFGADAQPEKATPTTMSAVNLGDFDSKLLPENTVLHRVYRYGADSGQLDLRVTSVTPEVRVISKQVLSLGDERVVLGINFATEITRAGLFQFSFPLPEGLEVESLTGAALHHWSELSEDGQRQIIMHLNGKTIGQQVFSLTLAGNSPDDTDGWNIPNVQLNEATRQTGELVVRPTTGIRLRTVSRQNVSETDPRSLGGKAQGALAFRLLQRDWELELGIEKLEPWVTGQVLHDVTLREGQTRTALLANFKVQNASIRSLLVELPITNADEIKTLRATGKVVSDLVRTAADSDVWEIQFKRRVVGNIDFRIEYERRGDRENDQETIKPAKFPAARQLGYYASVRTGGRLEVASDTATPGWQPVDWNTVPQMLREAGNRNAPAVVLRGAAPQRTLTITAARHSVADALKLRVTKGLLKTVLSPSGDQLTSVDLTMEVIQRSSLSVGLPQGGELLSIFVNGESVNSIRKGNENAWQFYILPGIDDRTATVRFVYSLKGDRLSRMRLVSPQLNVPLENISWSVVAPQGYRLNNHAGDLELIRTKRTRKYDRRSYLNKVRGKRNQQAQQAAQLLQQANQLIQSGQQTKARWALNSVANRYALDAASNEDARVQLENLQRQQAIVGLNTRRQRLYLYNDASSAQAVEDNQQLREAAAVNPILLDNEMNFRPQQLSQLLRGNTSEDNATLGQIAGRLVQHQRGTEPAPQGIVISLPEEGSVYTFRRTVQVAEDAPLELALRFGSPRTTSAWKSALVVFLLIVFAATLVYFTRPKVATSE